MSTLPPDGKISPSLGQEGRCTRAVSRSEMRRSRDSNFKCKTYTPDGEDLQEKKSLWKAEILGKANPLGRLERIN
jgi:hypothetical protein